MHFDEIWCKLHRFLQIFRSFKNHLRLKIDLEKGPLSYSIISFFPIYIVFKKYCINIPHKLRKKMSIIDAKRLEISQNVVKAVISDLWWIGGLLGVPGGEFDGEPIFSVQYTITVTDSLAQIFATSQPHEYGS